MSAPPDDAFELICPSEARTRELATALARVLEAEDLVALVGPVGAGKTVLVRGICEALAVPRSAGVSSPTYALVNLYDGGELPIAHLDLYRLGDADELEALGFRDILASERLALVEWAERAAEVLEAADLRVTITDLGPEERAFRLEGPAERLASLARALEERP